MDEGFRDRRTRRARRARGFAGDLKLCRRSCVRFVKLTPEPAACGFGANLLEAVALRSARRSPSCARPIGREGRDPYAGRRDRTPDRSPRHRRQASPAAIVRRGGPQRRPASPGCFEMAPLPLRIYSGCCRASAVPRPGSATLCIVRRVANGSGHDRCPAERRISIRGLADRFP